MQPVYSSCTGAELMRYPVVSTTLAIIASFYGATAAEQEVQPIVKNDIVFAETNGLVAVEAEHFVSQHETDVRAWYLVRENAVPEKEPDPDGNHVQGASGACYLECLPDSRATHDEKLIPGENFFSTPGLAGILSYKIHFSQPGRYYVWVRHFSTGTEDNGLHVGLNGTWPESGQRWQTTKKRRWAWDSRQRTSEVHTGVRYQLYLDVDTAGVHQIQFSVREDGFEFDKFILALERDYVPEGFGPEPSLKSGTLPNCR